MSGDKEENEQNWVVRPDLETQTVLLENVPSRELYLLEELAQRLYSGVIDEDSEYDYKDEFTTHYSEKQKWEIRVETISAAIFDAAEKELGEAGLRKVLDRYRKEQELLRPEQEEKQPKSKPDMTL